MIFITLSEPYGECIEVFKHLPPEIIDRTVALIGNDEIKGLCWNFWIVRDLFRLAFCWRKIKKRLFIILCIIFGFSLEHGKEPLNGGDTHPAHRV